jgi:hypothetical protein
MSIFSEALNGIKTTAGVLGKVGKGMSSATSTAMVTSGTARSFRGIRKYALAGAVAGGLYGLHRYQSSPEARRNIARARRLGY